MPNIFNSIRIKLAVYALFSSICTLLVDGMVVITLMFINDKDFLYTIFGVDRSRPSLPNNTGSVINDITAPLGDIDSNFIKIQPKPLLTDYLFVDILLLIALTIILYMLFYILFSHNMIEYFRTINKGIERIKSGDLNTNIPVKGYDEISTMAYSINSMRIELKDTIQKERRTEQAKNEMITNVAHDLRTPLTSMIGYLDLIRNHKEIDEQTRDNYINIAYDKSKRLQRLIQELFDYTRFEKDKLQITKSRIDITKFLVQLYEEFYPTLEENRLNCITDLPKRSIYVDADGGLLARAMGNLMTNAIKYGADGKQIRIELNTFSEKHQVRICLINYGKIIPPKDIDKIFEKFYRVDSSRNSTGTGLGLAIAKNIIEMHDGHISVRSDENGTVFEIWLNESIKEDTHENKEI